ncbi:hypothetical protein SOVF_174340 isoform A [Spinacia oleracea]|nr:hypothetical protein SOVF_174340 isoform A [Spinacia oleracea]
MACSFMVLTAPISLISLSINRRPDAVYGQRLVYKRPFLDEFLKFCLERFEVGIWSSAKEN